MNTPLQKRFLSRGGAGQPEHLELVRGDITDYNALKEHHYRADRPATLTRVLAIRHTERSAMDRFTHTPATPRTVAVLTESLPSLSCKMRNFALNDRYGTWLEPGPRARLLNSEVRVISRVVVHPTWRGMGLAVRLVRAALADPTTIYTEALAAMGSVNPFFERAGMTAYHRPPHAFDTRLIDAMHSAGLSPHDLADPDRLLATIASFPSSKRDWFHKELHRWYRQNGGRNTVHSTDPAEHLRTARRKLMLEPVYYLHHNMAKHTNNPCPSNPSNSTASAPIPPTATSCPSA